MVAAVNKFSNTVTVVVETTILVVPLSTHPNNLYVPFPNAAVSAAVYVMVNVLPDPVAALDAMDPADPERVYFSVQPSDAE